MRGLLARLFSGLLAVGAIAAVVLLLIGIFGAAPDSSSALPDAPAGENPIAPTSAAPTSTEPSTPPSTPASTPATSVPPTGAGTAPLFADMDVVVLNSTDVSGLASRVSEYLGGLGWRVGEPANFLTVLETTTVYYPEGQEEAARQLAAAAPGAADTIALAIPEVAPDALTVVVGADATTWVPPPVPPDGETTLPVTPSLPAETASPGATTGPPLDD